MTGKERAETIKRRDRSNLGFSCPSFLNVFIKMAENANMWKSDYPRKHFYVLGAAGLLLSIAIIVLEVKSFNTKQ